ncbi:MAG: DUF2802 domain-containing protein [Pseudomonadota bacterium]
MTVATLTYPGALAVVFAFMFIVTFTTLLGVRRRLHQQDGNLRRLAELVASRGDVSTELAAPGLVRVEQELDSVNARLQELVHAQLEQCKISSPRSLTDATGCAREGLPVEEISRRCGLSTGEAELLVRLHGPR